MTADVRVAVVGAGRWAQVAHIPGWQRDPRADVVALADVNETVLAEAAGNGIGRPSVGWDLDLQLGGPFRPEDGTADLAPVGLLLGDLVAVSDLDARYNMGFRRGWLTVGVVVHGASPLPGHGPGITPILTGPAGALGARPDGVAHTGLTEAALQQLTGAKVQLQ
jgi:hypothetical protein